MNTTNNLLIVANICCFFLNIAFWPNPMNTFVAGLNLMATVNLIGKRCAD